MNDLDHYGIETYPVGLFSDLKQKRYRTGIKHLIYLVNDRNWHGVRQYFNGYLAEWNYPPEGMWHYRCGRGWTRKAAIRRLGKHIAAANLSKVELKRQGLL